MRSEPMMSSHFTDFDAEIAEYIRRALILTFISTVALSNQIISNQSSQMATTFTTSIAPGAGLTTAGEAKLAGSIPASGTVNISHSLPV